MKPAPLPEGLHIHGDKIVKYLLNPDHAEGGPKARFFLGFGFSVDRTTEFADALFFQATASTDWTETPGEDGTHVVVCRGPIETPSGRRPWVKTVWQIDVDGDGRFVTAFPAKPPKA